jgi:multisubunit Na+/H+ antiporter MnhG subunit
MFSLLAFAVVLAALATPVVVHRIAQAVLRSSVVITRLN